MGVWVGVGMVGEEDWKGCINAHKTEEKFSLQ